MGNSAVPRAAAGAPVSPFFRFPDLQHSWATSDSESSAAERRLLWGFGAFWPLGFKALCGRASAGLPPAREGFFIASTHLGWE
jgi:hypothetical protein